MRVDLNQVSALSPLLFGIAVDVIMEHAKEGFLNKISYADDLALVSESMGNFREKF